LGDASSVDALLVAAARWRKKEPASALESEWCAAASRFFQRSLRRRRRENVWDALALVVRAGAHGALGELEGVELALKMMPARAAARALDYASATSEAICCKIVDAVRAACARGSHAALGAQGGLGVLFAALKAREGKKRRRVSGVDEAVPHGARARWRAASNARARTGAQCSRCWRRWCCSCARAASNASA